MKKLSKREKTILNGIVKGMKNKDLAKVVLTKEGKHSNEKTISTYKVRLMTKLGLTPDNSVLDIIRRAEQEGLIDKTSYTPLEVELLIRKAFDFVNTDVICEGFLSKTKINNWIKNNI